MKSKQVVVRVIIVVILAHALKPVIENPYANACPDMAENFVKFDKIFAQTRLVKVVNAKIQQMVSFVNVHRQR